MSFNPNSNYPYLRPKVRNTVPAPPVVQKRHTDRQLYFQELSSTTEKYLVPGILKLTRLEAGIKVAEVGCSIGGNLNPFLKRGCTVYGIDRDPKRISDAQDLLSESAGKSDNIHLIAQDIFAVEEKPELRFHLIILRDTIEHIDDKNLLLQKLKRMLLPGGIIYIAFPPWRMPFGGHHQVCKSFLSKLPWFHLLPGFLYFGILKMMNEDPTVIASLRDDRRTGFSIGKFRSLMKKNGYETLQEITHVINPHYEIKFGLKPRILPRFLAIPWFVDFYVTSHSCFARPL